MERPTTASFSPSFIFLVNRKYARAASSGPLLLLLLRVVPPNLENRARNRIDWEKWRVEEEEEETFVVEKTV